MILESEKRKNYISRMGLGEVDEKVGSWEEPVERRQFPPSKAIATIGKWSDALPGIESKAEITGSTFSLSSQEDVFSESLSVFNFYHESLYVTLSI